MTGRKEAPERTGKHRCNMYGWHHSDPYLNKSFFTRNDLLSNPIKLNVFIEKRRICIWIVFTDELTRYESVKLSQT